MLSAIRQKVAAGERLNRDEGLFLLQEANLLDLAPLAQEVRYRLNPQSCRDLRRGHQPQLHQRLRRLLHLLRLLPHGAGRRRLYPFRGRGYGHDRRSRTKRALQLCSCRVA